MSLPFAANRTLRAPHVCRACALPLVQPGDWAAVGRSWRVVLRCPSCGYEAEELLDRPTLDRFEKELDSGSEQLTRALARLTHRNMCEYAERFVAALVADAIRPEDF
jgi:hypothetical protein